LYAQILKQKKKKKKKNSYVPKNHKHLFCHFE